MTTCGSVNDLNMTWGQDLTILCHADFHYLPGVYALFNSAVLNGFLGKFLLLVDDNHGIDLSALPKHPQLAARTFSGLSKDYHFNVSRLAALKDLPDGKYLHLDADMIIERPCGHLFAGIGEILVVSAEPEAKYDQFDVLLYDQAKATGLSHQLKPFAYVNGGLLGFSIPEHKDLVHSWADLSFAHLRDRNLMSPINWFCLDQCMLNLLIRQPSAPPVFAISPRQLEFGYFGTLFQDRPFPWTKQGTLNPGDQTKFIIHGSGLNRPWLKRQRSSVKGLFATFLESLGLLGFIQVPRPYERAWAFYACSENLPIPYSHWEKQHSFTKHKNIFWRLAHGIC